MESRLDIKMGNDYYGKSERILAPDGRICLAEDVLGCYLITKSYYERYRKPVMHTETNLFDSDRAPVWLWKQWVNVLRMRADGVPVLGFTGCSLTDQVDWDTSLAERNGNVNPCCLCDLDRKPRPDADALSFAAEGVRARSRSCQTRRCSKSRTRMPA